METQIQVFPNVFSLQTAKEEFLTGKQNKGREIRTGHSNPSSLRGSFAAFSLEELKKGLFGSARGGGPNRKPLFNSSVGKNIISSGIFLLLLGKYKFGGLKN